MEVGGTDSGAYTVHEVNHTVEFKALTQATDVDVPARIVDWLEATVAAFDDSDQTDIDADEVTA